MLVPSNVECTLSSDLTADTVTVQGTVKINVAKVVKIQAQAIDIQAGGKISADEVTTGGPGLGTTLGSGGKMLFCTIILLSKIFRIFIYKNKYI